jgi:formamidopyrimidine-DNA glycosylase
MPELPEVETVRRGLEPHVVGRRIVSAVVRDTRLRWPVPPHFSDYVAGKTIHRVDRRGKYLIFHLDDATAGDRLIVHLGMSGRLYALNEDVPLLKHDHLDLELDPVVDGVRRLRFNDPRRFGAVLPWPATEAGHLLIDQMGPEPLSSAFSAQHLHALSRGRSAAVKNFVMDGRVVVGVGNIYASESLFRAGLRPTRAAGRITRPQYARLVQSIREVLEAAIVQGGTTLRDFAGARGESGYFQQKLDVYGREGLPCHVCGTAIRRRVIGQRSSFFCPVCQR